MDKLEVKVIGPKPPKKPDGPLKRMLRKLRGALGALLMRPRALVLIALAGFVILIGTPHAGWDYECRHPMRSGQPCRSVSYCAYYGIQGRRVVFPEHGETCQLVTFLPIAWRRLLIGAVPEARPSALAFDHPKRRLQGGAQAELKLTSNLEIQAKMPVQNLRDLS
jgi:hypothetical protein